ERRPGAGVALRVDAQNPSRVVDHEAVQRLLVDAAFAQQRYELLARHGEVALEPARLAVEELKNPTRIGRLVMREEDLRGKASFDQVEHDLGVLFDRSGGRTDAVDAKHDATLGEPAVHGAVLHRRSPADVAYNDPIEVGA